MVVDGLGRRSDGWERHGFLTALLAYDASVFAAPTVSCLTAEDNLCKSPFDTGRWDGILTAIVREADGRREQLLGVEGSASFSAVIGAMCGRACHLMKTITRADVQSFESILAVLPSVLIPLPDSPTSVADNTTCGTFWSAATAFAEQRSRKLRRKRSGQSSSPIDAAFLTFVRDITSRRHPTTKGQTTPATVHPLIPPFCTAALTYATDALSKNATATDEAALRTVHALLTQHDAATALSRG